MSVVDQEMSQKMAELNIEETQVAPHVQAVILAAGKGTRMNSPLPKVLHKVKGESMVGHVMKNAAPLCPEPILIVGHEAQMVIDHAGPRCGYVHQTEQNGTGHALIVAREALAERAPKNVLVLYGDQPLISTNTLQSLVDERERHDAPIAVATVQAPDFDGYHEAYVAYGRMIRDEQDNIVRIVEKKDANEEELAVMEFNTGIYCFETQWLLEHLQHLSTDNAQGEYYLTDLVGFAAEQGKPVRGVAVANTYEGLGANTPEQVKALEQFI